MKISRNLRQVLQSIAAVFLGFVAIAILSGATKHMVYRSGGWGAVYEPRRNLLLLACESLYIVVGSYIAAKVAPGKLMLFALGLGVVIAALQLNNAIFRLRTYDTGPVWVPVMLMLAALPCAWLGGVLARKKAAA
jgi:hypothetical protein